MSTIPNCPCGFEDGHIVGYRASSSGLEVEYEFWNEKHGRLVFDGLIGVRDNSAIGVTVSVLAEKRQSDFVDALVCRLYECPPDDLRWRHFQFLDLDDQPMFEVVAESCVFAE